MTAGSNIGIGLRLVRYGIAPDQKYLLDPFAATYDQLVVNANMLAHMPSAMSQFLSTRCRKQFIIDPQTHAFQQAIEHLLSTSKKSSGELKRSWKTLIAAYGEPLTSAIDSDDPRSLLPSDFTDDNIGDFCRRVLLFQKNKVTQEISEGEDAEYITFVAQETGAANLGSAPPFLLVAPYFFIGGNLQDEWLKVNASCIATSRKIVNEENYQLPLAAQVVISKEVLSDKDLRRSVADAFLDARPDVVLFWIDSFSEQFASRAQLEYFIEFVDMLSRTQAPVVNLYGGFFSVAQARVGKLNGKLCGICHGLEHGESKPVIPVTGGIAVAKFYSNNLHHRLPVRVAYSEIHALDAFKTSTDYYNKICNCEQCRTIIGDKPREDFQAYSESTSKFIARSGMRVSMEFPTARASDNCTRHYMWCKAREYRDVFTRDELKETLKRAHNVLVKYVGSEFASHANIWSTLL